MSAGVVWLFDERCIDSLNEDLCSCRFARCSGVVAEFVVGETRSLCGNVYLVFCTLSDAVLDLLFCWNVSRKLLLGENVVCEIVVSQNVVDEFQVYVFVTCI